MLKMTRSAALAAVLLIAVAGAAVPPATVAQAQPAAPGAVTSPGAPTTQAAPAAAPPAPAVAPKAANGVRSTEVVDNPYGLEALWKGGDMVARITLGILVVMSLGSWYIIVTKVYEQYRMNRQARAAEKTFWKAASVREGATS